MSAGDPVAWCTHPRARHTHGTLTASRKDGCSCEDCRAVRRRYDKRQAHLTATGRSPWGDVDAVRAHLHQLLADGLTISQIESRSGVNRTAIRYLLGIAAGRPAAGRVRVETAAKLLAVRSSSGTDKHCLLDGTGTARRLKALVAIGWTQTALTKRLGVTRCNFPRLLRGGRVQAATHHAVVALYEQLWDSPPPTLTPMQRRTAADSVAHATLRGWAPPMAWDDDAIDDPRALPSGLDHEAIRTARIAEVRRLLDAGVSRPKIIRRIGVHIGRDVGRMLTSAGEHELAARWDALRDERFIRCTKVA